MGFLLAVARGPALPARLTAAGVPALGVPGPREDCRSEEDAAGRLSRRRLESREESRMGWTWMEGVGGWGPVDRGEGCRCCCVGWTRRAREEWAIVVEGGAAAMLEWMGWRGVVVPVVGIERGGSRLPGVEWRREGMRGSGGMTPSV